MCEQVEMIGYHGTCKSSVKSIMENGFTYHKREDHWLGQGIYFFKYETPARWWAKMQSKSKYGTNRDSAVVKAWIAAESDKVLDIEDPKVQEELRRYFHDVIEVMLTESCRKVSKEKMRCIFFDYYKEENGIAVIICPFIYNKPQYQSKDFHEDRFFSNMKIPILQTQICVDSNYFIRCKSVIQDEVV